MSYLDDMNIVGNFVFPLCGFSLSLFCNYNVSKLTPAAGAFRRLCVNDDGVRGVKLSDLFIFLFFRTSAATPQNRLVRR